MPQFNIKRDKNNASLWQRVIRENFRGIEIIVVTQNLDTFTNPILVIFFKKILERGHSIILFTDQQRKDMPKNLENLHLFPLYAYPIDYYRFPIKPLAILKNILKFIKYYCITIKLLGRKPGKIIIGIDPQGLILAHQIWGYMNKPRLGYFSFEIFFWNELWKKEHYPLKRNEVKASQYIDFCIVQDQERKKILKFENRINRHCRFFHIPVAPRKTEWPFTTHKKCRAPCKVILSGTLAAWNGAEQILDLLQSRWNQGFHVEFHSRFKLKPKDPYRRRIEILKSSGLPVTLHDDPFLNLKEYYVYLDQFDIGLATYFPHLEPSIYTGKNIGFIGLSSGKFSTYMLLGLPTVTMDNVVYRQLNEAYGFGEVIKKISELPNALDKIRGNYVKLHEGCINIYNSVLNPDPPLNDLLDYFER